MAHLTNFSFEFLYVIFTEDASPLLLYYGAKKSKWPKTQIKGVLPSFYQTGGRSFEIDFFFRWNRADLWHNDTVVTPAKHVEDFELIKKRAPFFGRCLFFFYCSLLIPQGAFNLLLHALNCFFLVKFVTLTTNSFRQLSKIEAWGAVFAWITFEGTKWRTIDVISIFPAANCGVKSRGAIKTLVGHPRWTTSRSGL